MHRRCCRESQPGKGCQSRCSINRTKPGTPGWAGTAQPRFLQRVPAVSSGFTRQGPSARSRRLPCFSTNLPQKRCEEEHVLWVPGLPATGSASACLGGLRLQCWCRRVTLQDGRRGERGHAAPLFPQEQAVELGTCSGCQGWEDLAVTLSLPRATGGHSPGRGR